MNPREANQNLIKLIGQHASMLQGGKFGVPEVADLQFMGKVHAFVEEVHTLIKSGVITEENFSTPVILGTAIEKMADKFLIILFFFLVEQITGAENLRPYGNVITQDFISAFSKNL
jgi:hypothetical protein